MESNITRNVLRISSFLENQEDPDFSPEWHRLQFSYGVHKDMEVFAGLEVNQ